MVSSGMLTANVVPSLPIIVTLMMEALNSSETSVGFCSGEVMFPVRYERVTKVSEDGIIQSHHLENQELYIVYCVSRLQKLSEFHIAHGNGRQL
jgi:hypothetical protein